MFSTCNSQNLHQLDVIHGYPQCNKGLKLAAWYFHRYYIISLANLNKIYFCFRNIWKQKIYNQIVMWVRILDKRMKKAGFMLIAVLLFIDLLNIFDFHILINEKFNSKQLTITDPCQLLNEASFPNSSFNDITYLFN